MTSGRLRLVAVGLVTGLLGAVLVVGGTASAGTVDVIMRARSFDPERISVGTDDAVLWRNTDSVAHTVTADDGSFDIVVDPGQTYSRTFTSAGTVDYHCRFHGNPGAGMFGVVEVTSTASTRQTGRLAGPDRIATAVAVSRYQFPDGASEVYLSRSDLNPDALVGGSLTRGPVLLVPSCGDLPSAVAAEIRRLDPTRVVALGGTGAVCDRILEQAVDA